MPTLMLASQLPSFAEAWTTLIDSLDLARRPEEIVQLVSGFHGVIAALVTAIGAACILRGYRWHKPIVVVLALMLGFGVGRLLIAEAGMPMVVALALGVLLAAIAQPLLKYTVAFFSGLVGAAIGATLWTILYPGEDSLAWAGGGMGFIALALTSFLFFKMMVIVFTSVSGGAMLVLGTIGLLLQVESIRPTIQEQIATDPRILPLLVATVAVVGFVYQHGAATQPAAEANEEE